MVVGGQQADWLVRADGIQRFAAQHVLWHQRLDPAHAGNGFFRGVGLDVGLEQGQHLLRVCVVDQRLEGESG
ncbi:hypothetical protein D3C80_2038110 [compost metagenome]